MSNKIYTLGFYNPEVKERYLSRYEGNIQHVISRIFKISAPLEIQLEKDLYEFNRDEIKKILFTADPLTVRASFQNGINIRNYIDWAIEEAYRSNSINPLAGLGEKWYEQFVDKGKELILHVDKINEIVDKCENKQDAVIIQLIFEGLYGKNYCELVMLKKNDVDGNVLTLRDNNGKPTRKITVSDKCIRLIEGALKETEYVKNNGDISEGTRSKITYLVDTDFVIKKSKTNVKDEGPVTPHVILRRIKTLQESFDVPYLTVTSIKYSGMLYYAKQLYEKDGDLTREHLAMIGAQFGINQILVNGKEEYDLRSAKKEFLNVETIKKIYGI